MFHTCLKQHDFTFLSKAATDTHVSNSLLIEAACSTSAAYEHQLHFPLQAGLLQYALLGCLASMPQKIHSEQIGAVCLPLMITTLSLLKLFSTERLSLLKIYKSLGFMLVVPGVLRHCPLLRYPTPLVVGQRSQANHTSTEI